VNILVLAVNVCDRIAGQCFALRRLGHHVSLRWGCCPRQAGMSAKWRIASDAELAECADDVRETHDRRALRAEAAAADAVLVHRPELVPLVDRCAWDVHDLYGSEADRLAAGRADGLCHVSPYLARVFRRRFHVPDHVPATLWPNAPPVEWLPASTPPLWSAEDGALHVGYAGGVQAVPGAHRYYLGLFRALAALPGVELHLWLPWPPPEYEALAGPHVTLHPRASFRGLAEGLARCDVSWAAFGWPPETDPENIRGAIPGKLGYACAVGTPVLIEEHMVAAARHAGPLAVPVRWESCLADPGYLLAKLTEAASLPRVRGVAMGPGPAAALAAVLRAVGAPEKA